MIVTHLKGGLGNQMFQYACGFALAKEFNTTHKLDLSYYSSIPSNHTKREFELSQFQISSSIANSSDILKTKGEDSSLTNFSEDINAKFYSIFTSIYPIKKYFGVKNLYLDGYFQSEKFFRNYRKEILKEFTLKQELETNEFSKIAKEIKDNNNSVSMHIRRGDYVSDEKTAKHHGVLDMNYYQEALNLLNIQNPHIFIFSDDINWVKNNFSFLPKNSCFVPDSSLNSAQSITLMSLCKHNIIANSSFSWWGAWLNRNNQKVVIAPKKWVKSILFVNPDIIPHGWHRIQ